MRRRRPDAICCRPIRARRNPPAPQQVAMPSPGEDLRVPGIALGAASCACGRLLWRALADAGSTAWHLARHRGRIPRGGAYVPRATPSHDAPRRMEVGRPGCPRPGASGLLRRDLPRGKGRTARSRRSVSGTPPCYPAEHRPDAHPPVRSGPPNNLQAMGRDRAAGKRDDLPSPAAAWNWPPASEYAAISAYPRVTAPDQNHFSVTSNACVKCLGPVIQFSTI